MIVLSHNSPHTADYADPCPFISGLLQIYSQELSHRAKNKHTNFIQPSDHCLDILSTQCQITPISRGGKWKLPGRRSTR
jgi:hypothetical protein